MVGWHNSLNRNLRYHPLGTLTIHLMVNQSTVSSPPTTQRVKHSMKNDLPITPVQSWGFVTQGGGLIGLITKPHTQAYRWSVQFWWPLIKRASTLHRQTVNSTRKLWWLTRHFISSLPALRYIGLITRSQKNGQVSRTADVISVEHSIFAATFQDRSGVALFISHRIAR